MSTTYSLAQLNTLPVADFVAALGGIFEHSPWVAEQVVGMRPFSNLDNLHSAMCAEVAAAGHAAQLALIQAHPELAGKAAMRKELTAESTKEQAGAGLDQCSPEEFARLNQLNSQYKQKFGFPFILAVRGFDRAGILREFERRVHLDPKDEMHECLQQINKIARFRLNDLVTE